MPGVYSCWRIRGGQLRRTLRQAATCTAIYWKRSFQTKTVVNWDCCAYFGEFGQLCTCTLQVLQSSELTLPVSLCWELREWEL